MTFGTGRPRLRVFLDEDGDEFPLYQFPWETNLHLSQVAAEHVQEGNWTPKGKLTLQPFEATS